MNPEVQKRDRRTATIWITVICLIPIIGALIFLFSKDEGGITGVQALGQLGKSFWIWAVIGTAAAFGLWYFFLRSYQAVKDFGAVRQLLVAGAIVMGLAWMKGCDAKADSVTTQKGRVGGAPAADTNRVPAEDMLPK